MFGLVPEVISCQKDLIKVVEEGAQKRTTNLRQVRKAKKTRKNIIIR